MLSTCCDVIRIAAMVKQDCAKGIITRLQHVKWFDRQHPPHAGQTNKEPISIEEALAKQALKRIASAGQVKLTSLGFHVILR